MHWLGWGVLVRAFIEGGWLAFGGGMTPVASDYVAPRTVKYAAQLGS